MPVNLRIRFNGSKSDLKPYWERIIFELPPQKGRDPSVLS